MAGSPVQTLPAPVSIRKTRPDRNPLQSRLLDLGFVTNGAAQHADEIEMVEISVTGPSMSTLSMQRLEKVGSAVCTIRAVIFTTLFVALLSTAAVWVTGHTIRSVEAQSKPIVHETFGDDDELLPHVTLLLSAGPVAACSAAGMIHQPESLMHTPCYLFQPPMGVPGTIGVFKPVRVSNCHLNWDNDDGQKQPWELEACWELQYGNATQSWSDDDVYDKLQLAQARWVSDGPQEHTRILTKDKGPFRCQELYPEATLQGCPAANVSCEDLVPRDTQCALLACTAATLQDYRFAPKDLGVGGVALLYEEGRDTPINGGVYIQSLCPETCANLAAPAVNRRPSWRSVAAGGGTDNDAATWLPLNSTVLSDVEPSAFFNISQPPDSRGPQATSVVPTASSTTTLSWWLSGVPKAAASDSRAFHPSVHTEFGGDKPWLCLQDVLVSGPHNGTRRTFELGVSSYLKGKLGDSY